MKQIITFILVLLVFTSGYATQITAIQSNNWSDKATWDLNRLPKNGDTIVIPLGFTVTADNNNNLNAVVIMIYGSLKLDNGKLKLDNSSKVIIETTGKITGQNSNDQISIGGVMKYKGNQGTLIGYGYADASTGSSPTGFIMGALPVNFTSFYAKRSGNDVVLNWSTATEINNSHFDIEKSTDGSTWRMIGIVIGNGTTSLTSNYAFTDKKETSAVVYYRILQVDQNGQKSYSSVKVIRNNAPKQEVNIYATSKNTISVDINGGSKNNMLVTILTMNGQVVAKQQYGTVSYKASIVVPNAVSGVYIVNVRDEKGWMESKKVIL
jgi:hypothetical protein